MRLVKKFVHYLQTRYLKIGVILMLLIQGSNKAYADSTDPFCGSSCPKITGGDVTSMVGKDIVTALRWMAVIAGGLLIIYSVMALFKQLKHGSEQNEHSGIASTVMFIGTGVVVGVLLIGFAWTGLNYAGG